MKTLTHLFIFVVMIFVSGCHNDPSSPELLSPTLPETAYDYSNIVIPHPLGSNSMESGQFKKAIADNPDVTDWGATLGRVLFYDTRLSINNAVSCASCHKQAFAFADPVAHSSGFEGRTTPRNSMAIINPIITDNLFWDSRADNTVDLTLQPVQNHIEMGMEDMDMLTGKLSKEDFYRDLFKKAFNNTIITPELISNALAQFLCSMTSFNSKYDHALKPGNNFAKFNELEKAGKELFFSDRLKCASCHNGINFAAQTIAGPYQSTEGTANIGLDLVSSDQGRRDGKFRIPSLRNIALTAPYMHDGRFATLDEVLDHYSHGIKPNKHLDPKFKDSNGNPIRLNLTDIEKSAIIAFLNTLTDKKFIKDKKYSNPFKS